jgi:hypothetical protein
LLIATVPAGTLVFGAINESIIFEFAPIVAPPPMIEAVISQLPSTIT